MPQFASGRIELPDSVVLKRQLLALERRVTASGREQIDHGPQRGQHDDVANVVVGLLYELRETVAEKTVAAILPGSRYDPEQDPHSPHWWGEKYFGGARPRSAIEQAGLIESPPAPRSYARQLWDEELAAQERRARQREDEIRAQQAQLDQDAAREQEQRNDKARRRAMGEERG
jgi:hypothetical protein